MRQVSFCSGRNQSTQTEGREKLSLDQLHILQFYYGILTNGKLCLLNYDKQETSEEFECLVLKSLNDIGESLRRKVEINDSNLNGRTAAERSITTEDTHHLTVWSQSPRRECLIQSLLELWVYLFGINMDILLELFHYFV